MIIAVLIELLVWLCALWFMAFLSTLLHELGHALGYMLATGTGVGISGSDGGNGCCTQKP